MALFAVDDDDVINAIDADPKKTYWCLDCFGPVKKRSGRNIAHFYHLKSAPRCRLYSKTEDHLLAQLELKRQFPEGALQIERPFSTISRIADLAWEEQKIIFEIQCSPLTEAEGEKRILDYKSIGYDLIWLLDDKRYNKRLLRPAEALLRTKCTYYLSIRQGAHCYDQFEVLSDNRRVMRGHKIRVDLTRPKFTPTKILTEGLPQQILALSTPRYFPKDRLFRALHGHPMAMHTWLQLEQRFSRPPTAPKWGRLKFWFLDRIFLPLLASWERRRRFKQRF